ncbi:MAG: short-chain dehydrogenase [Euryarchaeota archaeon]|nr:short-chain dehydrogenase [Euryarchaeota archaeon]MDE1837625.1 short-chain dehydrogenase [Euryarchaeota archaeon]MDE1880817.1 short-chain dehydrogenase [Euryarchaeota archaeon]
MADPSSHALVVGGTGMLYDVSLNLAARGYATSVIARDPVRLEELRARAAAVGGRIEPMPVDYGETGSLEVALRERRDLLGPPGLVVAWVHGSAPTALPTLVRWLREEQTAVRLVHVVGSAVADPSADSADELTSKLSGSSIRLQTVILGFVLEGEAGTQRSRWLTDREISAGVLRAIDSGSPRSIVGQVEPWHLRP